MTSFGLKLLKYLKFPQNVLTIKKMGKTKQKKTKKRSKRGKKDGKTPPAKKIDDMTNEELNALLIPGNSLLDEDYGMERVST